MLKIFKFGKGRCCIILMIKMFQFWGRREFAIFWRSFQYSPPWERQTPVAHPGPIKMLITNTSKEGGSVFFSTFFHIFYYFFSLFAKSRCRQKIGRYETYLKLILLSSIQPISKQVEQTRVVFQDFSIKLWLFMLRNSKNPHSKGAFQSCCLFVTRFVGECKLVMPARQNMVTFGLPKKDNFSKIIFDDK